MKNIKKILSLLLCACIVLGTSGLFGCSQNKSEEKITVLCTVFPVYDWARNIVGDSESIEVSLLIKNGTDAHSFQPSFSDMADIKKSSAVVYIGGDADEWIAESIEGDTVSVELAELEGITLYSSSSVADENHEGHSHSESFDEHLWLSVRNAMAACEYLCELLCELDGENTELYEGNAELYLQKLSELDGKLGKIGENASERVIFADRFPFAYLFEDYSLEYISAFEGCSTDTDASFEVVIKLADALKNSPSSYVAVTESPTVGLADKIIAESGRQDVEIITLDSMQSVTEKQRADGVNYIDVMEKNVGVLEKILG